MSISASVMHVLSSEDDKAGQNSIWRGGKTHETPPLAQWLLTVDGY